MATYNEEDIPAPEYMIMTGKELRDYYLHIQEINLNQDIIEGGGNPADQEHILRIESLRRGTWLEEATILYPQEGTYKVILIDEVGDRVEVGEQVEYVGKGSEITEAVIDGCFFYVWDLTGEPHGLTVYVEGTDCFDVPFYTEVVTDGTNSSFCAKGTPSASAGVLIIDTGNQRCNELPPYI